MNKLEKYLTFDQHLPIIIGGIILSLVVIFYVGWQAGRGSSTNSLSALFRQNGFFRTAPSNPTDFVPQNASSPRTVRNPSEPVPAGTIILAEEFSLMVENRYEIVGNDIIIFMVIENLSNNPKLFRYRNSSIILKDDARNIYRSTVEGENFSAVKQFSFGPGEILSMDSTCHDTLYKLPQCIPRYLGPIKSEANKIRVTIEQLGPFNEIVVEIEL